MVSYEYAACQAKRKGVLVMSIYAGAAKTLPSCVIINPWDTPRFAGTIGQVLNMSIEEREARHNDISEVVNKWTR